MAAAQSTRKRRCRPAITQPFIAPDGKPCLRVELTKGQFALIDQSDAARVEQHVWHARKWRQSFYAQTQINGRHVLMHRFILKCDSVQVDHRNWNGLDNRRENLRPCTPSQNVAHSRLTKKNSTSVFRGVHRKGENWRAKITVLGKHVVLGTFRSAVRAALIYDAESQKQFGEFSIVNFPEMQRAIRGGHISEFEMLPRVMSRKESSVHANLCRAALAKE